MTKLECLEALCDVWETYGDIAYSGNTTTQQNQVRNFLDNIPELEAEIEALNGKAERLQALIDADRDYIEALRKDAKRYRWSRKHRVEVFDAEDNTLVYGTTPEEIDESYDVAMERKCLMMES